MTDPYRTCAALAALAGALLLGACSSLPGFGNDRAAEEAADKAGRVAMVLGDEKLEADPELASQSITLPVAETPSSWPEAGMRASKAVGHVIAADELVVDWRRNAGEGSSRKSALTSSPVASETAIFVLDAGQTVRAFDVASGREFWRHELSSGNERDRVGVGGALAVSGGRVIAASGYGRVFALDAATGDQVWMRDMEAPMTGSPTVKDGRIYVTSNNNEVFALDFDTGRTLWSDQAIAEPARVLGSPSAAAVEDLVVVPYSSGEIIAYLANNGRRLWNDALSRPGRFTPISSINDIAARPVLSSGLVIAANQSGVTAAIDGRSGNRVWAQPIGSTQAPALAGEYLFVMGTEGLLAAMNAGTGRVYWTTQLARFRNEEKQKGRISYAGPIIASGRVIVISSQGEVIAIDPQTGERKASLDLRDDVYLEPIAVGGRLFVLTDEAQLIAIR